MAGAGVEAAVLTRPVTIDYLCGFRADPHERLMALAVGPRGARLVVPDLEAENARQSGTPAEIAGWRDGQDPFALVVEALDGAGRVGVEKDSLTLDRAERLRELIGGAPLEDAGPGVRGLRAVKDPAEVEALAAAARITDAVTEAVLEWLRPGLTELEVARRVEAEIDSRGCAPSFATAVQSGPNSARPHLGPGERRIQRGDLVLLDFGAADHGYRADTTRMAVVGQPDPRQIEVHRAVLAANRAGVAAVGAGVTAGEVDAAARRVLVEAGLGEAFIHRVGHGIGLEAHEHPSLDPGSQTVLEPGMAVTIEPGAYLPGWGGVRIEDDVIVEAGGGRVLTTADRGLRTL